MQFKETLNLTTNKKYYYIDGKRVTKDRFDLIDLVQQRAGKRYNSSLVQTKGNLRHSYYSYD